MQSPAFPFQTKELFIFQRDMKKDIDLYKLNFMRNKNAPGFLIRKWQSLECLSIYGNYSFMTQHNAMTDEIFMRLKMFCEWNKYCFIESFTLYDAFEV